MVYDVDSPERNIQANSGWIIMKVWYPEENSYPLVPAIKSFQLLVLLWQYMTDNSTKYIAVLSF